MAIPLPKSHTQISVPYSGSQNAYYFVPNPIKNYVRAITILSIFTSKSLKNIFKNLHTILIRASLLTRLITRGRAVRANATNAIISREMKHISQFMKTVQIQISKINKLTLKYVTTIFVQKAGEIGTTFLRLINVPVVYTVRFSKILFKNVLSVLISNNRINKTKITNTKVNTIYNNRLNKQKQWYPKTNTVQISRFVKIKTTTIEIIKILTNRLNKQKNTNIKSSVIFPIRFNKKALKQSTTSQIVSATVTRAVSRRRGITSGITYTIASNRAATYLRQLKAITINILKLNKGIIKNLYITTINTLRLNKGIVKNLYIATINLAKFNKNAIKDIKITTINSLKSNKGIIKNLYTSTINTLFVTRDNIVWKFILKVVTKIVSFKSQGINKSGYAIPDPDPINPNMIDSSTPSVQGLIYGNPDDDSFIE